jgi:hypothetical protein
MFNLFSKPITNLYYYKCGVNNNTTQVDCTKSQTDFKEFDKPEDYTNVMILAISKEIAETESQTFIPPSGTGVLASASWLMKSRTAMMTGEERILSSELYTDIGTRKYNIIDK